MSGVKPSPVPSNALPTPPSSILPGSRHSTNPNPPGRAGRRETGAQTRGALEDGYDVDNSMDQCIWSRRESSEDFLSPRLSMYRHSNGRGCGALSYVAQSTPVGYSFEMLREVNLNEGSNQYESSYSESHVQLKEVESVDESERRHDASKNHLLSEVANSEVNCQFEDANPRQSVKSVKPDSQSMQSQSQVGSVNQFDKLSSVVVSSEANGQFEALNPRLSVKSQSDKSDRENSREVTGANSDYVSDSDLLREVYRRYIELSSRSNNPGLQYSVVE